MRRQLTLDAKVPLPHVGNVEVGIDRSREREGALRQRETRGRLCLWETYTRNLVCSGCRGGARGILSGVYRVHIRQRKGRVRTGVAGEVEELPVAKQAIPGT